MLNFMEFTIIRKDFSKAVISSGTAIVIGNFDGVHKGHQTLIMQGINIAAQKGLTPTLYTFEPHPKKLFLGKKAPKIITSFASKAKLLKKMGIQLLIARPFTKAFADTHFEDFVLHLKNDLNVKVVVVGEDFAFGKNREGTAKTLKTLGFENGFETIIVNDVKCDDSTRYSSSRIRENLALGRVQKAWKLLGRPFLVSSYLYENSNCNLVAHFSRYTSVKNGVYLAKIQYTDPSIEMDTCVMPIKVENNTGYIPPLPNLPNLVEGKINLNLIDKIEE